LLDLNETIAAHGTAILRYCHGILCNYHDAQDAVQLTFIKAHRAGFARGDIPLAAWLYRIAYNTCIDILRKRRRFFSLFTKFEGSYEIEDNYINEDLAAALRCLSARDRALVFNRVIDGMSYEELSDIYKASPAALRKRYERARRVLAARLEGSGL